RGGAGKGLDPNTIRSVNRHMSLAAFTFSFDRESGLKLTPRQLNWQSVMAELVRSAVELVTVHDVRRIKTCANPDCSWMFYDESLNRSRQWCQVNYCGNLLKVRDFRMRHRQAQRATNRRQPVAVSS
ncbi:MAG: CGNR zinc finger domain-containing protein, partial [Candidatus Dormibacterales bacterium]